MRFRFTLASVLRFRASVEQSEELALQRIMFEMARVSRQIEELAGEMAKANEERETALQRCIPASELKSRQDEMSAAMAAKHALSDTLKDLNSQRDAQLELYQMARVNRRVLTDLLEQKQAAWERDQVRAEQKVIDDLFGARKRRV
jgi:flagellar FliJ protein